MLIRVQVAAAHGSVIYQARLITNSADVILVPWLFLDSF